MEIVQIETKHFRLFGYNTMKIKEGVNEYQAYSKIPSRNNGIILENTRGILQNSLFIRNWKNNLNKIQFNMYM